MPFGDKADHLSAGLRNTQEQILRLAAQTRMPVNLPTNPLISNMSDNLASEFCSRLMDWIRDFEQLLDQGHEVGVRLVSFGQTLVFSLAEIGYRNPSLISFSGHTKDGDPVELIQHVSQISILLMRLPRQNPEEPRPPIGFRKPAEDEAPPDQD